MISVFLHSLRSLLLFLLFLVLTMHLSGYATSDSDILEYSKFWPEKVTVNVEITGVTHGNIVKSGNEWIFLRYQDGKCLVDMGHNGIHALNLEDTDILERIEKVSKERIFPFRGLFTHYYTKAFYDPKTLRGHQLGDMDEYDYFVLIYFDYESGSDTTIVLSKFIEKYLDELRSEMKTEVLLLPSRNLIAEEVLKDYISDGLIAPTITPFLRESVVHTLKHDHEVKGDVVLVDKFGKILDQFFLSRFKEPDEMITAIRTSLRRSTS